MNPAAISQILQKVMSGQQLNQQEQQLWQAISQQMKGSGQGMQGMQGQMPHAQMPQVPSPQMQNQPPNPQQTQQLQQLLQMLSQGGMQSLGGPQQGQ